MTYRRTLFPICAGFLLVVPFLVLFACVGTTAQSGPNEGSRASLTSPALETVESARVVIQDSPVSSPEIRSCVRPLVDGVEIRGRLVPLPDSICVVATDKDAVQIQVKGGYSWVEIDTRTGDVVDGDLYVEERERFPEFEGVMGRRLYGDGVEGERPGLATAKTGAREIAAPFSGAPKNDITPEGGLPGVAVTSTATATRVLRSPVSPTPAPMYTPEPDEALSPSPSASPVSTTAATVAHAPSPTARPTQTATPTPEDVDVGPRLVCEYSGTEQPVIKGNVGSGGERIFHTPDSAYYGRTEIDESKGEVWFCTEEAALKAGWRALLSQATGSATSTPVAVEPHSIDINLASVSELKMLPSIGEVKARAIVDHRELNGPFTSVEGLIDVKGIGPATLDKVRDFITIR